MILRFVFFIFFSSCLGYSAVPDQMVTPPLRHLHFSKPESRKVQGPPHEQKKQLIILDAGHGGTEFGARVPSLIEKKIALITTLLTKKCLAEMGYRIILTRSRDVTISLPKRVAIANKSKADLFVSIHYNASRAKEAKGIEIFYYPNGEPQRSRSSRLLAQSILGELLDQTRALSRGVKQGNHHVTRESTVPAVLVEGGFITNAEERSLLRDRSYLEKIARGIAMGIDRYLK